jgi:hypothetical protein
MPRAGYPGMGQIDFGEQWRAEYADQQRSQPGGYYTERRPYRCDHGTQVTNLNQANALWRDRAPAYYEYDDFGRPKLVGNPMRWPLPR